MIDSIELLAIEQIAAKWQGAAADTFRSVIRHELRAGANITGRKAQAIRHTFRFLWNINK